MGLKLWKSDGTEVGTTLLKDIYPGPQPRTATYGPHELVDVSGTLFFVNGDESTGDELWKSDGTELGLCS